MFYLLLLFCSITTTPEQRQKYEPACIEEVAGKNAHPATLLIHKERIAACVLAKAGVPAKTHSR